MDVLRVLRSALFSDAASVEVPLRLQIEFPWPQGNLCTKPFLRTCQYVVDREVHEKWDWMLYS